MKIVIAFIIGMSTAFIIDGVMLRVAGISWRMIAMNVELPSK